MAVRPSEKLRWLLSFVVAFGCNTVPPQQSAVDGDASSPDGASWDGNPSDTGPHVPTCGTPGVVRGPFPAKEMNFGGGGQVAYTDGRMIFTTSANLLFYGTYATARGSVDLTENSTEIAVEAVTKPGFSTQFYLARGPDSTVALEKQMIGAQILVGDGQIIANVEGNERKLPYSPSAHRIWRFREHAKTLTLEASPDRTQWSELLSVPSPPWIRSAMVGFILDIFSPNAASGVGRAVFSEFNQGSSAANWCQAVDLKDNFASGISELAWSKHSDEPECKTAAAGGDVIFSQTNNGGGACNTELYSRALYDLRNSIAEIATAPIEGDRHGWQAFLRATKHSGTYLLYLSDNKMCAGTDYSPSSGDTCVPYNGARYWRFAHDGTALAWQISKDRASWTTIRAEPMGNDLTPVRVSFGSHRTGALDTPLEFRVTDYNPQ